VKEWVTGLLSWRKGKKNKICVSATLFCNSDACLYVYKDAQQSSDNI
jgi:hypothetical protein